MTIRRQARGLVNSVLGISALLATACTERSSPDLNGTWNYRAFELRASGLSCTLENMQLSLRQIGDQITGTSTVAHINCSGAKATAAGFDLPVSGSVRGTVDGSAVTFDL